MKILYFDCSMGAAGDMMVAALLELIKDKEGFVSRLNSLGIPRVQVAMEQSIKCGITGTHFKVVVNGEEEESLDGHEHGHEHHHHHDHEHDHDFDHHDHHNQHDHHDHDHHDHHDFDHHDHHNQHDHHDHEHDHDHDFDHHDHYNQHVHHDHDHTTLDDISNIVSGLPLSEKVKADISNVYSLIAEAEGAVHGKPVDQIHFHEVGTMDALMDVTAACMLMEELKVERIYASPVHVGSGTVKCAHGILPVPAPATALILRDIPIYGGKISGELCTPTGAALLKYFVHEFGPMPVMSSEAIGYGMGKKDFDVANCLRVFLGEKDEAVNKVAELTCDLDDMTPEEIGCAMDRLFDAGALEVHTTTIGMKKNRPGIMLTVLCKPEEKESMAKAIFAHTTTIGIREQILSRYVLDRETENVETDFGSLRRKVSSGYGVSRSKFEYDDLVKIAIEKGLSLPGVKDLISQKALISKKL